MIGLAFEPWQHEPFSAKLLENTEPERLETHLYKPPLTLAQLDGLLAFLPEFEASEFRPGAWQQGPDYFRWYRYHPRVIEFVEYLHTDNIMCLFDFKRVSMIYWRCEENLQEIARYGLEDLRGLLTDTVGLPFRNYDAWVAEKFESGLIVAILRRMKELRPQLIHSPSP